MLAAMICWVLGGIAIEIMAFALWGSGAIEDNWFYYSPFDFYDSVKMNWFGSWICFLLFQLISPAGAVIRLTILLFFIGRED